MKFTDAAKIKEVIDDLKSAEEVRSSDRAMVNDLFNGLPPYTQAEQEDNDINTNVNFLDAPQLAANARRQYENAFLKPGGYFVVTLDFGPIHKRSEWGSIITRALRRQMKKSLAYVEVLRSTFANTVLHGIGPANWHNTESWRPIALGVEDVLIPSRTLLTMENLECASIFRRYSPGQLWKMVHGPKVDPGWNVTLADKVIEKLEKDRLAKANASTIEWSAEKISESIKENSGYYDSDVVATVDAWDFYFWDHENGSTCWKRRILLDQPVDDKSKEVEFLYDGGKRAYANEFGQILHFQFGDASATGPFRYHSVRSLGYLLYAVCHLQNRLRCRLGDAAFGALLQYFRSRSPEDAHKIRKVDLVHLGIVPEGIEWVKGTDRYTPDPALIESVMSQNRMSMIQSSSAYTQDYDYGRRKAEQTATEIMAQMNSSSALVGAMLNMAYNYYRFQCLEIARRFCIVNSADPDVRSFRQEVLAAGVPEEMLDHNRWNVEPERVLGQGNKVLEIAQVDRLMQARSLFDPEPQRYILHDFVLATTDDPDRAARYAPISQQPVSDAMHDAQLAAGALMQGLPVYLKTGMDHIEYVETLLTGMEQVVAGIEQSGGMATAAQVVGLNNLAKHVAEHIGIIAQNKGEKARVKLYGDQLGKLMNNVRAYEERLAEQAQQSQAQMDPQAMAKIEAQRIQAEAKAANTRESHAQRTAQRQVSWQKEEMRREQEHELEMARRMREAAIEVAAKDAATSAEIMRENAKALAQPKEPKE